MAESNPLSTGAAWMNGQVMPLSEARLPVNDWGLIHSDITYDVVPVWNGGVLPSCRLSRPLRKLDAGAPHGYRHGCVTDQAGPDGYGGRLRIEGGLCRHGGVTRCAADPRDTRPAGLRQSLLCLVRSYIHVMRPELPPEARTAWIAKSVTRIPRSSVDPRVKNYHWGDFTAGLFEAKDLGFETVILLDEDGHVTEGPASTSLPSPATRLVTSDHGMLEGISRRTVIEMAREIGMNVEIRPLPLTEFMESDEVFISTSGGGVIGLTKVDDRIFANAAVGPVTGKLHETYWDWMMHPAFRTEIGYR